MTSKELEQYLERYISENGTQVRLGELAASFEGFKPHYSPRKGTAPDSAARSAAIARAVTNLYNALLEAVMHNTLTLSDAEGDVDFGEVSESHGGKAMRGKKVPNYLVTLDERFKQFTQGLGRSLGGPKGASPGKPRQRSENAEKLVAALEALSKSANKDAKAFVATYKEVQTELRLPKFP